jgi:hypothetical protein
VVVIMAGEETHRPGPGVDEGATWVFDLDGCLIDSLTGRSLRPGAVEVLSQLRDGAVAVMMWSAGGAVYAQERVTALGIERYFQSFHDKQGRGADGRYTTEGFLSGRRLVIFVDDHPEDLPIDADVVAVRPYLAANPHDRGLEPVALRAELGRARS